MGIFDVFGTNAIEESDRLNEKSLSPKNNTRDGVWKNMSFLKKSIITGMLIGLAYSTLTLIFYGFARPGCEPMCPIILYVTHPWLDLISFRMFREIDAYLGISGSVVFIMMYVVDIVIAVSVTTLFGLVRRWLRNRVFWLKYLVIIDVLVLVPLIIIFWLPQFSNWSRNIILIGTIIVLAITSIVGVLIAFAVGKKRPK